MNNIKVQQDVHVSLQTREEKSRGNDYFFLHRQAHCKAVTRETSIRKKKNLIFDDIFDGMLAKKVKKTFCLGKLG